MVDDTAELNARIAAARTTLTLDKGRVYNCASSVHVLGKAHLDIDMNGATILRTVRQRGRQVMSVHAKDCGYLGLHGGKIVGKKDPDQGYVTAVEGHHGVGLFACAGVVLSDLAIAHVPGDFCYQTSVGKRDKLRPCGTVVLENVDCFDAGRHAVAALAVERLIIRDSVFYGWNRKRIDLEQGGAYKTLPRNVTDVGNIWQK